jgi:hypothetical protein
MITRRAMVATGASLFACRAVAAGLPVPPGESLGFRIIRHGGEIGRHTLNFAQQGDTLTVRIAVKAVVTMLSVPIVRYNQQAEETWRGGVLAALEGQTDDNGRKQWVRAQRGPNGLAVTGSQTAPYTAPENALGSSYWNRQMLDGPMISLEDGVLLRPKAQPRGVEGVRVASGAVISADRTVLTGPINVDVWYDEAGMWASLGLTAVDGSDIRYERL